MFDEYAKKVAAYNSTLPTLTDGDERELQLDANGRLIVVTSGAPISIDDNGGSLTVDATDLDIRDLDSASDSVAAVQSGAWSVSVSNFPATQPVSGTVSVDNFPASQTVDATDLDIRDLSHTQDSIQIGDGTEIALVDASGNLQVVESNSADILTALQLIDDVVKLEDAAHASGDAGIMALAVRQDTLSSLVSADGDYASLKVNAQGELYVTGSFDASVDDVFESATEADAGSDPTGDGIVAVTASMTDLATIAVGAGETLYIVGLDISADKQVTYDLIVDDDGTPSEWIRAGVIDGAESHGKTFPRAIEITGAANRSVILRAAVNQGSSGNASGGINAYKR